VTFLHGLWSDRPKSAWTKLVSYWNFSWGGIFDSWGGISPPQKCLDKTLVRPQNVFRIPTKFGMWMEVDEWCTKVCHVTRSKIKVKVTEVWIKNSIQFSSKMRKWPISKSISSANETWVVSSFGLQLLEKMHFAWPHSDRNSALFLTKALRSKNKASIDYLFGTFKHTLSPQWTPPWSPI